MRFFKAKYLLCGNGCGRFSARDAAGMPRKGAATVRHIINVQRVPQHCPRCGREWRGVAR